MRKPLLVAFVLVLAAPLCAQERPTTTVGMPARIEQLILPGTELEVRPLEDRDRPIIVRILAVYPHGTAFRYDLTYYGLEPGTFDLTEYLRRKDGSPTGGLPPMEVEITPVLPPGQVLPNALEGKPAPFLGGYRIALVIGAILWVLGLLAILFVGRRKQGDSGHGGDRVETLADRLRPLVEGAVAGTLTETQRADLERMLLAYWRRRLDLGEIKPVEAFALLRNHPEAGPLLGQLEAWLHQPNPDREVDLAGLLAPYKELPADALEPHPK